MFAQAESLLQYFTIYIVLTNFIIIKMQNKKIDRQYSLSI
ncbi:hypothetical protein SYNTR_0847 [Candidatus Syntrophocurvum alkaliphilum]|uniref:Uncharacterized protein n=1 Tax=Candidatus Syntrophocurvum alkaliphilum TaxID=2293317 RepID=A0A6I6DGB4_9FIRM|nr:hypothetical protein SYNTR_0847 [Candidatus Syntrophocurvum alkaliphilum]